MSDAPAPLDPKAERERKKKEKIAKEFALKNFLSTVIIMSKRSPGFLTSPLQRRILSS